MIQTNRVTPMTIFRTFACGALMLALLSPVSASARVIKIETSAPLPDQSEQAIDTALEKALDTCLRGAAAMGLSWIWLDRALVLTDKVIVKMTASDEEAEGGDVKEAERVPGPMTF